MYIRVEVVHDSWMKSFLFLGQQVTPMYAFCQPTPDNQFLLRCKIGQLIVKRTILQQVVECCHDLERVMDSS